MIFVARGGAMHIPGHSLNLGWGRRYIRYMGPGFRGLSSVKLVETTIHTPV